MNDSFVAVAVTETDRRGSIREIGAVDVRVGRIIDSRVWGGPSFDVVEAFEAVREFTGSRFLVAHDGVYVARALADAYVERGYAAPTLAYLCSLLMCRREFPRRGLLPAGGSDQVGSRSARGFVGSRSGSGDGRPGSRVGKALEGGLA